MGQGSQVTSARRLPGGISSAVHALTVQRGGRTEQVVLRRFVREDWLAREPDLATHEAVALRIVEGGGLPAPRLIAVDDDGSQAGAPSVLSTLLIGRPVIVPGDMDSWLRRMAEALPVIHAIRPSPTQLPYSYKPYYDIVGLRLPEWSRCPDVWTKALAAAGERRPSADEHLIHRDYHPANILWQRGHITGIVDWVNSCRGPAGVDIGHCRRNLAILHGVEVADRFLDECLRWANYDPYWDVVTLLDALPGPQPFAGWSALGADVTLETVRGRADGYVASLVERL